MTLSKYREKVPYFAICFAAIVATHVTIIPLSIFFLALAGYLPGRTLLAKIGVATDSVESKILAVMLSIFSIMIVLGLCSWVLFIFFRMSIINSSSASVLNCFLGCLFYKRHKFELMNFPELFIEKFRRLHYGVVVPSILIPILGFIGGVYWNNAASNSLDNLVSFASCIALLIVVLLQRHLNSGQIILLLFTGAWSIMIVHAGLGSGMLPGSDPKSEFATAYQTLHAGYWVPSTGTNTYTAMLSITVLPAVLSLLGHLSLISVYRYLYVFLFALFPIIAFRVAATLSTKKIAAFLTVLWNSASTNYTQLDEMPYRQGIANLYIASSVLILCHPKWSVKQKRLMILICFGGVSVSHYSSAYVLLLLILIVCILRIPSTVYKFARHQRSPDVLALRIGVAFLAMVVVWEALINPLIPSQYHTIKQIQKVAKYAPNTKSISIIDRILKGDPSSNATPSTSTLILYTRFSSFGAQQPQGRYLSSFNPLEKPDVILYPQYSGLVRTSISDKIKTVALIFKTFFQLITLIEFCGFVLLSILSLRDFKIRIPRKLYSVPLANFEIYLLCLASFVLGVGLKVSPQLNYLYTAARSVLSIYFLTLPLLVLGIYRVGISLSNRKLKGALFAVSFVFTSQALLTGAYLGNQWLGGEPRLSPTNIGEGSGLITFPQDINQVGFYNDYYPGRLIYSADLFVLNNLNATVPPQNSPIVTVPTLMNQNLLKGSLVFLSKANLSSGKATAADPTSGLRYQYKIDFPYLNAHSFSVYESPGGETRMIHE